MPVRIHLWRDDNGNATSNRNTVQNCIDVFNNANAIYAANNADIQFYQDGAVVLENSTNYNRDLDDIVEAIGFFAAEGTVGKVDIHFINTSPFNDVGFSVMPYLPTSPNINNLPFGRWSCYVGTNSQGTNDQAITLAHELGHVLGLFHTHHPGRDPKLYADPDLENAKINNSCYQEMVDRNAENKIFGGCFASAGKLKCEINGDFLCDTEADPGSIFVGTTVMERGVTLPTETPPCTFINNSTDMDYTTDNDDDHWTPPVHNYMSYSRNACLDEFTNSQINVMHYTLEKFFYNDLFDPVYTLPSYVCNTGRTISLNNAPSGMSLEWSVSPRDLFSSTTWSGTGTNAFVKAASSTVQGLATISFYEANSCDIFYTDTTFWVGKPLFRHGTLTGPSTLYTGSNGLYQAPKADHKTYYQWTFPDGGFKIISGQGTNTARIQALSGTGLKVIQLRAYNDCGYTYKYITVDIEKAPTGGGTDPCANTLSVSPNPTTGDVIAYVIYPPGGGGGIDPCTASTISSQDSVNINPESFSMESIEKDGVVQIISKEGELVYQKKHCGKKININLRHLDPGVYVIHYMYNDEELLSTKFIKE